MIIGAAMKVHSVLGNGFQEVIYQRALAIEMKKQGPGFKRDMEMHRSRPVTANIMFGTNTFPYLKALIFELYLKKIDLRL